MALEKAFATNDTSTFQEIIENCEMVCQLFYSVNSDKRDKNFFNSIAKKLILP